MKWGQADQNGVRFVHFSIYRMGRGCCHGDLCNIKMDGDHFFIDVCEGDMTSFPAIYNFPCISKELMYRNLFNVLG